MQSLDSVLNYFLYIDFMLLIMIIILLLLNNLISIIKMFMFFSKFAVVNDIFIII